MSTLPPLLDDDNKSCLRVSSKTKVNQVAHSIRKAVEYRGRVELQAVGGGAVNQVVKAAAIARSSMEIVCVPSFRDIKINGEDRTATMPTHLTEDDILLLADLRNMPK